MAKTQTFQCTVVTPERPVLDVPATFVAFPAHDGEIGIMVDRAPLLAKVGTGLLRIESTGKKHVLFVDGGFAQMAGNKLTILTEQARRAEEIDSAAASKKLTEAQAMKTPTEQAVADRSKAIKRAKVQIEAARSAGKA